MRALLLAMHKWVKEGAAPPPSQYPQLQDRTLVPAASVAFPAIPGVASPRALIGGAASANRFLPGGAGAGTPLPLLVPAVDEDGNERAGIRLPRRRRAARDLHRLELPQAGDRLAGRARVAARFVDPVPGDARCAREAKDPRRSIEERYRSQDEYLAQVQKGLDDLVIKGYLRLRRWTADPAARRPDEWDLLVTDARSPGPKR